MQKSLHAIRQAMYDDCSIQIFKNAENQNLFSSKSHDRGSGSKESDTSPISPISEYSMWLRNQCHPRKMESCLTTKNADVMTGTSLFS